MLIELPSNSSKTLFCVLPALRQSGDEPGGRNSCPGESGAKATAVQTLRDRARWLARSSRHCPAPTPTTARTSKVKTIFPRAVIFFPPNGLLYFKLPTPNFTALDTAVPGSCHLSRLFVTLTLQLQTATASKVISSQRTTVGLPHQTAAGLLEGADSAKTQATS
jgi:hypothetical protein